jgi:hypothetical protein
MNTFGFRIVRFNIIKSINCNQYYYNENNVKLNIYHPAIIVNDKTNSIKYINMKDQNIDIINKMIFDDLIKKYLKLKIIVDENDKILLTDDIICYQFKKKIVKSIISFDNINNYEPVHMLINVDDDDKNGENGGNAMMKISNQEIMYL